MIECGLSVIRVIAYKVDKLICSKLINKYARSKMSLENRKQDNREEKIPIKVKIVWLRKEYIIRGVKIEKNHHFIIYDIYL